MDVGDRSNDVLYVGPGRDDMNDNDGGDGDDFGLDGGPGEDVLYGGAGHEYLGGADGQRDKLYCGKGKDKYEADTIDYVSSNCEEGKLVDTGGPPLILLACAALLSSGLVMIRYMIDRDS